MWKALKAVWQTVNAVSTATWLWGLPWATGFAVITGWLAAAEHVPPVYIGLSALAAFAVVYVIYVAFRIERLQAQPDLSERVRQRSLENKADIVADIVSGSYNRGDDGSEAFRKNGLARKRLRARTEDARKPSEWVPLHVALRYLVYESRWGVKQPAVQTEDEFNRVVSTEVRERIARGDIASRGQLGWDDQSLLRATEPIPPKYWIDAFFLPYASIALAENGGDEIAKQGGGGPVYRGVILRWPDVKSTWIGGGSPSGASSFLATFVEDARAKIAAEGKPRSARGILAAMDDELAEQQEKAFRRLEAVLPLDKVQKVRAGKYRDTTLAEALGWAAYGEWGKPYHGLPFTIALSGAPNVRDLLDRVTNLAGEGNLTVWGKRDDPGYYEEIPRSHWQDNELSLPDVFGSVVSGAENPYRNLMLNKAEVEREWPHEG